VTKLSNNHADRHQKIAKQRLTLFWCWCIKNSDAKAS